jgi:periplasmic protein TonB
MCVEEEKGREEFGALGGCFVGGDAEQRKRERRVKRRALAISVSLQAFVLAVIILIPLFGRPERIAFATVMPLPPYYHSVGQVQRTVSQPIQTAQIRDFWLHYAPPNAPARSFSGTADRPEDPFGPGGPEGPEGPAGPSCIAGCIDIGTNNRGPIAPVVDTTPKTPKRIVVTHLEAAMLTRRIEPVYPTLARQTRREGRVELHAIIGTDGTIQALQVVSGDVLFYESAKDAVAQWRYKPTYLNNRAVEVDTTITVIYTLGH